MAISAQKYAILALWLASQVDSDAQNCNYYLYHNDTLNYKACIAAEKSQGHYQYSKAYQIACDEALRINPNYSHAYSHKSTAYLKSGDFLEYERLMAKAVAIDPHTYLGDRACCRYCSFRNYAGAIEDFEAMRALNGEISGFSSDGDYHLLVAYALCHKALGNSDKAIDILEAHVSDSINIGPYDALHLAVLYLDIGQLDRALKTIRLQEERNNLADVQFYYAKVLFEKGDIEGSRRKIGQAKALYDQGSHMRHDYVHHQDRIFYKNILDLEVILEGH